MQQWAVTIELDYGEEDAAPVRQYVERVECSGPGVAADIAIKRHHRLFGERPNIVSIEPADG